MCGASYDRCMGKIISHVVGGLGNQMFQYAIARAMALRTGRQLELDASSFRKYQLRRYLLDQFRIAAKPASKWALLPMRLRPKEAGRVLRRIAGWQVIEEREHAYHALDCRESSPVLYLRGYWQSEKYFLEIADIIRSDFQFVREPDPVNARMLASIGDCESVALHIRRGDYVSNPTTAAFHGICDLDYYHKAVRTLEEQVQHPHFYIFSDDIPWVRENLKLPHPTTYVDHNSSMEPCDDLRLMAECRHFVIANSSFSWWGAWLSKHPEKIVIAPNRWFQSTEKDTRDQIPDGWTRI